MRADFKERSKCPETQSANQPASRARRHFLGISAAATATLAIPFASTALAKLAILYKRNGTVYEGGDTGGESIGQFHRRWIDRDGDRVDRRPERHHAAQHAGDRTGTFTSRRVITRRWTRAGTACGSGVPARADADGPQRAPRLFLPGTRILTSRGEVPVEELRIGDLVVTVRGESKPIKWVGRQSFKKSGPAWQDSVMPIRIARGALDENTPHQDLYVSPVHALLIDGFLMPAMDLVNGTSIAHALPDGREVIEYVHVVLDSHEVVLAEGAPAETLLVTSAHEYERFANFAQYERLYGTPRVAPAMYDRSQVALAGSGRAHLKALLGLGVAYVMGRRDPPPETYNRIAERAEKVDS